MRSRAAYLIEPVSVEALSLKMSPNVAPGGDALGFFHQLHCGVVDIHVVELNVGSVGATLVTTPFQNWKVLGHDPSILTKV